MHGVFEQIEDLHAWKATRSRGPRLEQMSTLILPGGPQPPSPCSLAIAAFFFSAAIDAGLASRRAA